MSLRPSAMHSYWTWFDVDVAYGLNAHIQYLAEALEENSCLFIRYLDKAVEIPICKRCFKTKTAVLSPLIRTSDVGREQLQNVREMLESDGFSLRLRRSPKKGFLNQVTVPVSVDDPLYPMKIRRILVTVAEVLGKDMPTHVVIGYHKNRFTETLPGDLHYDSKAATLGFKLGRAIGSKLRND